MYFPRSKAALTRIAILLLSVILNFHHLDHTSLWNDEGFSFFAADSGLAHTLRFISDDTQPPVYYLSLSVWLGLGTSVFVIRALSAAAMTLALLPLHATAKRLFDERTALLATLLFAVAPMGLTWAQKARPYPLQVLLVACAFWGFVRVCRAGDKIIGTGLRAAIRTRTPGLVSVDLAWLAYAVFGALAMLAQAPGGFFVLGCNVAMALAIFSDIRRNRILLLNWVIAQLLLILIWMLWLPAFLHQIATHLTAAQIATKHAIFLVRFGDVLGVLRGLFGVAALGRPGPLFAVFCVAIACFGIIQIGRRRPDAWPLIVVIVVPIAACLSGFFLVHPIFGYVIYTFVWILIPYSILISFGILSIRPMALRGGILAVLLMGDVWGLKNVYQTGTPPLDQVAFVIRADLAPGDGVVLGEESSGRWGIAYYLGPPYGAVPGLDIQDWDNGRQIHSMSDLSGLRRVWVVVLDGETPAVDTDALRRTMKPTFSKRVGDFQITRFE
jgi:4-amino-4-deoxy-L-arabinose transferase-like glycosyltransferase